MVRKKARLTSNDPLSSTDQVLVGLSNLSNNSQAQGVNNISSEQADKLNSQVDEKLESQEVQRSTSQQVNNEQPKNGQVNQLSGQQVKYLSLLKAILFCLVHKNLDFAANLVRRSPLSESKKLPILELLSQPLNPTPMLVNPDNPYITSKIELRKIHEDWWKTEH